MKGLILAAGRGSRMGALTDAKPKCLTELAGKPLLQWQLEAFGEAGVQDVALVTGYQAAQLEAFNRPAFHNPRWAETNMVGSLLQAKEWLKSGPVLVSYSDIVYHSRHLKTLMDAPGELAITYDTCWKDLWTLRFSDPLSDAETFKIDADDRLLEIGQKPETLSEIQGQYMGLLKFTPAAWQWIENELHTLSGSEQDRLHMTGLLNLLLKRGYPVRTVPVAGQWCEVDSADDKTLYENELATGASWRHDWRVLSAATGF